MKNVIITGTSRGIGIELAKFFSDAGHNVLALSRNAVPIQEMSLKNCEAFSFDITKASDIEMVSAYIGEHWKQVDILINNSGLLVNDSFSEINIQDFRRVYEVNVFGVAAITQAVIPFMKKDGHVVTISSIGGIQGSLKFPGLSAYSSSKGAVITLSELLAEEFKETGPSFNVLALGAVQTEMLEEAFPGYKAPLTADEMASYIYDFALTANKFYKFPVQHHN
jgi:3-oxoacyl-[acyl-carrier protein] reductase